MAVQSLVLEFCCTLLAGLLVLLAVGLLAVHAAVLDEAAGRAVLELVVPLAAARQLAHSFSAARSNEMQLIALINVSGVAAG